MNTEKLNFFKLPLLIKEYLKINGLIGDRFFVAYQFNIINVCVVVFTDEITKHYKIRFL